MAIFYKILQGSMFNAQNLMKLFDKDVLNKHLFIACLCILKSNACTAKN